MGGRAAVGWFALGTLFGWALARDWSPEPRITWSSEHGVLVATTPGQAYRALELAGEYCANLPDPRDSRRRKFAVLTATTARTLGVLRFDCIPHVELVFVPR